MALANARYNLTRSWFLDMRVNSIQDVARQAIQTPDEMGNRLSAVVDKLSATPFYLPLLEPSAHPGSPGSAYCGRSSNTCRRCFRTHRDLTRRCGQMDITVIPDYAVVFDAREMRGLEIFTGAGGIQCNRCHELPAATNVWQANNGLDAQPTDLGIRSVWLRRNGQDGMFRPAALRNIALSAPYMHDGRFSTLREVIDHYDHDIKASPDLDSLLRDTNNNPLRMNLSEADKDALEGPAHADGRRDARRPEILRSLPVSRQWRVSQADVRGRPSAAFLFRPGRIGACQTRGALRLQPPPDAARVGGARQLAE